jgi:hypothetical protein
MKRGNPLTKCEKCPACTGKKKAQCLVLAAEKRRRRAVSAPPGSSRSTRSSGARPPRRAATNTAQLPPAPSKVGPRQQRGTYPAAAGASFTFPEGQTRDRRQGRTNARSTAARPSAGDRTHAKGAAAVNARRAAGTAAARKANSLAARLVARRAHRPREGARGFSGRRSHQPCFSCDAGVGCPRSCQGAPKGQQWPPGPC